jgi:hypothetical protein
MSIVLADRPHTTDRDHPMPAHTVTANRPHLYIQCDVPEGQTLLEWRRERTASDRRTPTRRPLRTLLKRLAA